MYPVCIGSYTVENDNTVPESDADISETQKDFIAK